MNLILRTFDRRRVLLPVVHACDPAQARAQAIVAFQCGADGVFLINQGGMEADEVVRAARDLKRENPKWFVGVNLLGVSTQEAISLLSDPLSGMWDDVVDPECIALTPIYFGGVAFKYQRPVLPTEWGAVAFRAAQQGVGVVTTSGPATGEPAPIAKVQAMREALGDHALALASGITSENVQAYLPYVDAFLVATGIERKFGEFDPHLIRDLGDLIHAH